MSSVVKNCKMYPPRSCDTFVIMPPFTKTGDVIFGKNSDRPQREVQEVIFVKGGFRQNPKLQCTYIAIDETQGPINDVILSKPGWTWGAEMGANDKNVAIGNESVRTNNNHGDGDPTITRLLGMDLVRLGLERGNTAEMALDTITSLLETYGQGGSCSESQDTNNCYHNSFLIADPREAWILETSGKIWVAERVECGWRNISNGLTITTKFDKQCRDLQGQTCRLGLWDGKTPYNFAVCFSPGCEDTRQQEGERLLRESSSGFDVKDMMNILRNKESRICRAAEDPYPTQGSQVSTLNRDVSVHWFTATADPSISLFKPFIFTPRVIVSEHTASPNEPGREHTLYKLHSEYKVSTRVKSTACRITEMESKFINDLELIPDKIKAGESSLKEFDRLFKYCVQAEMRFYIEF